MISCFGGKFYKASYCSTTFVKESQYQLFVIIFETSPDNNDLKSYSNLYPDNKVFFNDFALSGLIFWLLHPVTQGFAAVLTDFALSGLCIKQALKGRDILTMGEAHRNQTITYLSPERVKYKTGRPVFN